MALAALSDVKRVMRIPASDVDEQRDSELRASLDAVTDWIEPLLTGLTKEGPQVQVFWDVFEDATLHMPNNDCLVTRVRAYGTPSTFEDNPPQDELRLGSGYDLDNEGRVMLRANLSYEPFEGALASRTLRTYSRVEVHYISTGVVPKHITEGIALLAAGYWTEGPALLQSIQHEKIGDYEYWTAAGSSGSSGGGAAGEAAYAQRAMKFLNSRIKRHRVAVT